jgi:HicB-like protein involved in pilus formation
MPVRVKASAKTVDRLVSRAAPAAMTGESGNEPAVLTECPARVEWQQRRPKDVSGTVQEARLLGVGLPKLNMSARGLQRAVRGIGGPGAADLVLDHERSIAFDTSDVNTTCGTIRRMEASGKFVLRLPMALHVQLTAEAKRQGVSLNQLCLALLAGGIGFKLDE